jgi:hypothetical protein
LIEKVAKPHVPYRLLQHRPVQLYPQDARPDVWTHDKDLSTLRVDTISQVLIDLGKTEASAFRLSLELNKTVWLGDVGIFLGYRPPQDEEHATFQTIEVRGVEGGKLFLMHLSYEMAQTERGPEVISSKTHKRYTLGDAPGLHGGTLEVTALAKTVHTVRWNGRELPAEFLGERPVSRLTAGTFGITNLGGATQIVDATFVLLK